MRVVDSRNVRQINSTTFGSLLFCLPPQEKSIARKLEKLLYKLNAAETAVIFNRICLQEGLLPKYTQLRLHDPDAARDGHTRAFRRRLAVRQLESKKDIVRRLKKEVADLRQQWTTTQEEDRAAIHLALKELVAKDYSKREKTTLNKLNRLNGGKLRAPKHKQRYLNLTT